MKPLSKMFAALLVSSAAFTAMPAMTGCYGVHGALIVEDTPPPPRAELVVTRPGYVWIPGHWTYVGGHWLWQPGYYERERPYAVYVDGRWERRGRGHVWVEGGWHERNNVIIRDRR